MATRISKRGKPLEKKSKSENNTGGFSTAFYLDGKEILTTAGKRPKKKVNSPKAEKMSVKRPTRKKTPKEAPTKPAPVKRTRKKAKKLPKDEQALKIERAKETVLELRHKREMREGQTMLREDAMHNFLVVLTSLSSSASALPAQMKAKFGKKFDSEMINEMKRRLAVFPELAKKAMEEMQ